MQSRISGGFIAMLLAFGPGADCAWSQYGGSIKGTALSGKARSSGWVQAHHTRVRFIAGGFSSDGEKLRYRTGVHIELDRGWKTYWRTPGGAGGVPPYFSWDGSKNLKSAVVRYPAPKRIVSEDGTSIGYKNAVVFPIDVEAVDPDKPVELALRLDYGVCKDICVPVQTDLGLSVVRTKAGRGSYGRGDAQLLEQFRLKVPVRTTKADKGAPSIKNVQIELEGPRPKLIVEARYPGGSQGADLFVEAPDGLYVALPSRTPLADGRGVRFEIDLTKGEDPKYLRDKELRLTLVGANGQSEAIWRVSSK